MVSEYTELYTRVFGKNLARAITASKITHEHALRCPLVMINSCFAEFALTNDAEPDVKRRRLSAKTTSPPGYPEPEGSTVGQACPNEPLVPEQESEDTKQQDFLVRALQFAPRVGRVILEKGELFEELQQMFPEHHIRVQRNRSLEKTSNSPCASRSTMAIVDGLTPSSAAACGLRAMDAMAESQQSPTGYQVPTSKTPGYDICPKERSSCKCSRVQ